MDGFVGTSKLKVQTKRSQIESDWDGELRALIETKAEMRVANMTLCERLGICNKIATDSPKMKRSIYRGQMSYEEYKLFSQSLETLEHEYEEEINVLDEHINKLRMQFERCYIHKYKCMISLS